MEPKFQGQHKDPAPPPMIINEVHWKGYGDKYNQWIAESGLPHAKQAIEDYWIRYSS